MNWLNLVLVGLSCLHLAHSYVKMRRDGRLYLLHVSSSLVVMSNFLLFPLVRFEPHGAVDATTTTRVLAAAGIFISLSMASQIVFYGRNGRRRISQIRMSPGSNVWLWIVFACGAVAFFRFFILNSAYHFIGDVLSTVLAGGAYYGARGEVASWLTRQTGVGLASATVAFNCVFPVVIALGFFTVREARRLLPICLVSGSIVMSVLFALVLSDRYYLLFSVLYPVTCFIVINAKGDVERQTMRFVSVRGFLAVMILLLSGAAVVYRFTDGADFMTGLRLALRRVFVVPATTSSYYYSLFPERFAFRGLGESLFIPVDPEWGGSTSIREVSLAATGSPIDANTGMLGTAYSGDGYAGVLLVTVLFLGLTVLIDRLFLRLDGRFRVINFLINLAGFVAITNVSLLVATNVFGYGLSSLGLLALLRLSQERKRVPRCAPARLAANIGRPSFRSGTV